MLPLFCRVALRCILQRSTDSMFRMRRVELQIQLNDIDARLAKHAQLSS